MIDSRLLPLMPSLAFFITPSLAFFITAGLVLAASYSQRVLRLLGHDSDPPDKWCIDVNDITGRWARIDESDLRTGFMAKGVLLHQWRTSDGLPYEAIVRIMQEAVNTRLFEGRDLSGKNKYKGRPMRIRNLATGDFIMADVLGLKPPEEPTKMTGEDLQQAASKATAWAAAGPSGGSGKMGP